MVATKRDTRKIIHIRYPCHVCGENCKTAGSVINHATLKHSQRLPSRRVGIKRPKSSLYRYEKDIQEEWDEQHFGCPSCWFHSDNFEVFQAHVEEMHCDTGSNVGAIKDSKDKKKSINFVDEQVEGDEENNKGPDLNEASDIAQKIVDLGNLLKGMLKI